jgi:uroporphyrinogen-III synthase
MEIVRPDPPDPSREGASLIFTSANAVPPPVPVLGRRAWCVGERTTAAARVSPGSTRLGRGLADELVRRLLTEGPAGRTDAPARHHQRGEVAERLSEGGPDCDVPCRLRSGSNAHPTTPSSRPCGDPRFWVPLFSPRSAALFVAAASDRGHRAPRTLSSRSARRFAATIPRTGPKGLQVCSSPTGAAMLDEVARRIFP